MQNGTVDIQYDITDTEMIKIGEIKQSETIRKLKDDNVYLLNIMSDNFQDELLKSNPSG